jgi:hypothetical protein
MKGAHLVMNEAVLQFLEDALDDISRVYSDDIHDNDPGLVVNALEAGKTYGVNPESLGLKWTPEEDKFGYKVYTSMPYAVNGHETGELRVTAVLKKGESLHLDIRPWGHYSYDNK